jgi:LuxR family maltose regulon positive regulatory protein
VTPENPVAWRVRSRQVEVLAGAGEMDRARDIADAMPASVGRDLVLVRIGLAAGQYDAVEKMLDGMKPHESVRDAFDVALARVALAAATGAPANIAADAVLDVGEPEGLLFGIAEAGALTLEAVRRAARRRVITPYVARLMRTTPHAVTATLATPEYAVDALSERERTVLRYLATAMSYREIADELFVSVNTVKTHVKSIIRKLQATSRADAIARATDRHYL